MKLNLTAEYGAANVPVLGNIPLDAQLLTPDNVSTPIVVYNTTSDIASYCAVVAVSASFLDGSQSAVWNFVTGFYRDGTGAHLFAAAAPVAVSASKGASAATWTVEALVTGNAWRLEVVGDAAIAVQWQVAVSLLPNKTIQGQ